MSEEELKAIERLENFINKYEPFVFYSKLKGDTAEVNPHIRDYDAYKTILNLISKQQKKIENSVSKDKIEEYLKEAEEKYQVYKKSVKNNEALKSGMWKHLGEVDVLKRILGKQRNVVTLDNKLERK